MNLDWRDALRDRLEVSTVRTDWPLSKVVTLRIGGPADCLVDIESEHDLEAVFDMIHERPLPYHVLGKGSNVLIPDEGLRGIVIRLGRAFSRLGLGASGGYVAAGAGMSNAAFVEQCRRHELGGMEYLIAIPGTIGGAIAMNAGAHDGETAAFLQAVRYFQVGGGIREDPADAFEFAYRDSPLTADAGRLVISGTFLLARMEPLEIQARLERFQQWRREHQPREFPNCGSVFKNPPGLFAARLIDQAGLKGVQKGGAQVSEKHANFIVNRRNASAADVVALIDLIRETVYSQTGVTLELEIQVLSASV